MTKSVFHMYVRADFFCIRKYMSTLFSLLYVENYRSIRNQMISFDHRYECDYASDGSLITIKKKLDKERSFGKFFYGKNIYSVTCLVGKNGEGKTSLVDFLRDSFALLKDDIDSGYSPDGVDLYKTETGIVELSGENAGYYHLDADTRFLVIFQENGRDCYLTNIGEERIRWDVRDRCPAYVPAEKEDVDFRVAYFSMMRFLDGVSEEETAYNREKDEKVKRPEGLGRSFEEILNRYNIDFSDEKMNRKRKLKGGFGINEDLFMQIAFLKSKSEKTVEEILGEDYKSRIEVYEVDGWRSRSLKELTGDLEWDERLIDELLNSPHAYFRPFSSGQYSRFAFLARLYWYMGGGEKFWKSSNMKNTLGVFERNYRFESKESIRWLKESQLSSESVVLLIDEGELYYHPEWQRCFVKDVFDIISEYEHYVNVQVVFTTSSTFMLSDILREDVVVLSEPNKQIEPYLDRNIQTFGQNIHMLLANRFFMDSTIGRKSEELITNLFEMLRIEERETPTNVRKRVREKIDRLFAAYINEHKTEFGNDAGYDAFIWKLIGSIGEDFYRRQLLGMFEEYKRKIRELNPPVVNEKETESRELEAVRKLLEKMKADDIMQKEDLQHALELLGQL